MNRNKKILFIIISSILMGLSQHQLSVGFFAWFGLIPFLHVLIHEKSYRNIFIVSFVWGILYNLIVLFWLSMNVGTIPIIAIIIMIAAVIIMSFNSVLSCILWFRITIRFPSYKFILFPIIWVAIEYIRSYGILGFPWISFANSQIDYFYLIQNAEITGIYGISFWIVVLNVMLYQIIFINKDKLQIIFTLILFAFPWFFGFYLFSKVDYNITESSLKLSLIQPNVNLENKRDLRLKNGNLESLINMSNVAVENGSKLIIWPESAVPFHHLQFPSQRNTIVEELLISDDIYLLSGNIIKDISDVYNASILFNKDEVKGEYYKRLPVPLAEYVPLSSLYPSLKKLNIGSSNFSKGQEDVLFNIDNIFFTGMICFESTFPEINRRHVNKGADALVYLVNDGWYESEPEPTQHAKQSIYRAIENRRPVIRCANTGISMIVNEKGEVQDKLDLNISGTLTTTIVKSTYKTFYTRFGNVFALILLIISSMFLLMTFKKNEKK